MPRNTVQRNMLRIISVATLLAATVFLWRGSMIFQFGLQFPINDQWGSEYVTLYKPLAEGTFEWRDFWKANNEHIILLQRMVHAGLFALTGEWNVLAQMILNAGLFSLLVFILAAAAGLIMPESRALIAYVIILLVGLLPTPAENLLWGFQTGWYLYYLFSFWCVWMLSRCKGLDTWWLGAFLAAALSALCLASGVVNLALCAGVVIWKEWAKPQSRGASLARSVVALLVVVPAALFTVATALDGRPAAMAAGDDAKLWSCLAEGWKVFSFPSNFLPLTYIPVLWWGVSVFRKHRWGVASVVTWPALLAVWAAMHAVLIVAGRGGFNWRYIELLCLGVIANAILVLLSRDSRGDGSESPAEGRGFSMPMWSRVWLAFILAMLAIDLVAGFKGLAYFKAMFGERQEVVRRLFSTGSAEDLMRRDTYAEGMPAHILAQNPEILRDPTLNKVMPSFYSPLMNLEPPADPGLAELSDSIYPTPFLFETWLKLGPTRGEQENKLRVSGASTPWLKIVYGGRDVSEATGIYRRGGEERVYAKASFSQAEGWRTVFLPVDDGSAEFSVRLEDPLDWMVLQRPQPCSQLQYDLERFGRFSGPLSTWSLGLTVFILALLANAVPQRLPEEPRSA
jgi:hypothetical protein